MPHSHPLGARHGQRDRPGCRVIGIRHDVHHLAERGLVLVACALHVEDGLEGSPILPAPPRQAPRSVPVFIGNGVVCRLSPPEFGRASRARPPDNTVPRFDRVAVEPSS